MSTGAKKVDIFLKKFLSQQQITENFFDFLEKKIHENLFWTFRSQGVFTPNVATTPILSADTNDTFDVVTPLIGIDDASRILSLDPLFANNVPFENTVAVDYFIGARFVQIPEETEINVRTGKIKYTFLTEGIGVKADPNVVVDDGDETLTITVDSVCEVGVSNAGRKVKVFLKGEGKSQVQAFEELTVIFTGGVNKIETTTALGQTLGNISTTAGDYEVILLGLEVKRNTDLTLDPAVMFVGKITGSGSPSVPSTFDHSSVNNLAFGLSSIIALFGAEHSLVDGSHLNITAQTITTKQATSGVQLDTRVNASDEDTPDAPVAHSLFASVGGTGIQGIKWRIRNAAGATIAFIDAHGNAYFQDIAAVGSLFTSDMTIGGDQRWLGNVNIVNPTLTFDLDTDNLSTGELLRITKNGGATVLAAITEIGDVISQIGSEYSSLSTGNAITGVNASLNEVYDQTLSRDLLRPTPNNPADKIINVASARKTIADGEEFGVLNNGIISPFAGATVNFGTGAVSVGNNFTAFTPSAASRFFKYGLSLNKLNEVEVVVPTSDFASKAAARADTTEPIFSKSQQVPIAIIIVEDDGAGGAGTIQNIDEDDIIRFNINGTRKVPDVTEGEGELTDVSFLAEMIDDFVDTPDGSQVTDIASGKTDTATYNTQNEYFRLEYDADKTVTGTGTSMVLSAAPAFTVKIGDILRAGIEARRITALGSINADGGSGTPFTIEAVFASDPTALQATVSQVWYSVDMNALTTDGQSIGSLIPIDIDQALILYQDTETIDDVIPDFGVAPHLAFDVSSDEIKYTSVKTRQEDVTDIENIIFLPTVSTSLFVRMFANKTSGTGFVNLLGIEIRWHRESDEVVGGILDQFYGLTDDSAPAINGTIDNSGALTRINLGFSYARGTNSGEAQGDLEVELDGKNIYRIATAGQDSFTEIDDNTIELNADFSGNAFTIVIKRSPGTIDSRDENANNILELQTYRTKAFRDFINTELELTPTATPGAPAAGLYFTKIINRKNIRDISQDLSTRMGPQRFHVNGVFQIQDELGPDGQQVLGLQNDKLGQARVYGPGEHLEDISGSLIHGPIEEQFLEITFFGTGLNITGFNNQVYDYRVRVDGGAEGAKIHPTAQSAVLLARGYSPRVIIPVVSGLALGIHTVSIRSVGAVANMNISGWETILTNTTPTELRTQQGSAFINRALVNLVAADSQVFNTTFESGVLGSRGGHVLTYIKSDKTIAKAVQPTDVAQLNLLAADHANEEIIRTYHFREFGSGRADDFSTLESSNSDRAFALEDGVTTLVGEEAVIDDAVSVREGISVALDKKLTFTFIGTGFDVTENRSIGLPLADTYQIFVDGVEITSGATASETLFPNHFGGRNKIVSGLPYGTHTVQLVRLLTAGNSPIFEHFIVYGPKQPTLPANATKLSSYFIMADYDGTAAAGDDSAEVPQGTIQKNIQREFLYQGTFTLTLKVDESPTSGFGVASLITGDKVDYTFWGTGINLLMKGLPGGVYRFKTRIDGVPTDGTIRGSNVAKCGGAAVGEYQMAINISDGRLEFTGLTLGVHTVQIEAIAGGVTTGFEFMGMNIITPIHVPDSAFEGVVKNALPVGNSSINDLRVFDATGIGEKDLPNCAQSQEISPSPTTTSVVFVPIPDAITTIKTSGNPIEVEFDTVFAVTGTPDIKYAIFVDGIKVKEKEHRNAAVEDDASIEKIVPVGPGIHTVQIKWLTDSDTLTSRERTLRVTELT